MTKPYKHDLSLLRAETPVMSKNLERWTSSRLGAPETAAATRIEFVTATDVADARRRCCYQKGRIRRLPMVYSMRTFTLSVQESILGERRSPERTKDL